MPPGRSPIATGVPAVQRTDSKPASELPQPTSTVPFADIPSTWLISVPPTMSPTLTQPVAAVHCAATNPPAIPILPATASPVAVIARGSLATGTPPAPSSGVSVSAPAHKKPSSVKRAELLRPTTTWPSSETASASLWTSPPGRSPSARNDAVAGAGAGAVPLSDWQPASAKPIHDTASAVSKREACGRAKLMRGKPPGARDARARARGSLARHRGMRHRRVRSGERHEPERVKGDAALLHVLPCQEVADDRYHGVVLEEDLLVAGVLDHQVGGVRGTPAELLALVGRGVEVERAGEEQDAGARHDRGAEVVAQVRHRGVGLVAQVHHVREPAR